MESIKSTINGNQGLIINLEDRLVTLEGNVLMGNNVTSIEDSLKLLDSCVHQILNKINLNQASISDLSMYKFMIYHICFIYYISKIHISNYY